MKKFFFKTILNIGSKFIEDSIPTERIHQYINDHITHLLGRLEKEDKALIPNDELNSILNIKNICERSNFLKEKPVWPNLPRRTEATPKMEFDNWFKSLKENKVILKGHISTHSGKFLNYILSSNKEQYKNFIKDNIEALMRHIEIKRKDSLHMFDQDLNKESLWIERHEIAILFARSSFF